MTESRINLSRQAIAEQLVKLGVKFQFAQSEVRRNGCLVMVGGLMTVSKVRQFHYARTIFIYYHRLRLSALINQSAPLHCVFCHGYALCKLLFPADGLGTVRRSG